MAELPMDDFSQAWPLCFDWSWLDEMPGKIYIRDAELKPIETFYIKI
jgi:hypothetical protein